MLRPIAFLWLSLLLAAPTVAESILTLSEKSFDFGYVPQNSKVSHVFWLRNAGDQDLKITKIIPGCGCTQAPLDKNLVPPGDSARLEIIFASRLYFNYVAKSPVIEYEGMPNPTSVTVATYVIPRPDSARPLVLEPFKLDLSQLGDEVRDRVTFSIVNITNDSFDLSLSDDFAEYGTLTMPPAIGPRDTVEAQFVLKPQVLGKDLTGSFTFQVEDKFRTRYTVPVRRKLKDPRVGELVAPKE